MTCPRCAGPMIPERDRWGGYKSCALGCGYVSYGDDPPDYTPPTRRGRRKEERLIGRPKREPYRKVRNSRQGVLGSGK